MKKGKFYIVFLFLFFLVLFFLLFLFSFKENYIILKKEKIKVIDGDTFKYENNTFRIVGIDTPEKGKQKSYILKKYKFKNETCLRYYALLAKEELEKLIKNSKETKIEIVGKDPYNRYLVILYVDNKDVAELIVKKGYAFLFEKSLYHKKYLDEFYYAKNNKLGVWSCY
ncbi:MAG TPA: thermonuclease family protein [Nautiliaceae bacterium]|nr:thermonuclease family protein [Nautiliaceae bacterium]